MFHNPATISDPPPLGIGTFDQAVKLGGGSLAAAGGPSMAWIKVGVGLDTRREVVLIASRLERDRFQTVGMLVAFWGWADGETTDGRLPGMTLELIDSIVGCTGFAAALLEPDVGWLARDNGCLELPKYDKHHSRAAKTRAMDASKKSRQRRDKTGTQTGPEKRRIEKKEENPPTPQSEGVGFFDFWEVVWAKVKQGAARTEWMAAVKSGVGLADIIDAAREFAESPAGQQGQYTPNPDTWLRDGRFRDDREQWWTHGLEGDPKREAARKYHKRRAIDERCAELTDAEWLSVRLSIFADWEQFRRDSQSKGETHPPVRPACVERGLHRTDPRARAEVFKYLEQTESAT